MKFISLLYIYLALFPLGQLLRIPPQSTQLQEVHFYLTDVVIAATVVFWLLFKFLKKEKWSYPPLVKPIFLFTLVSSVSLLLSFGDLSLRHWGISSLYLIRWFVYAGIYFVVYDVVRREPPKREKITNALIVTGLITAILGLIQYILVPDTRFLANYGWDPHYYRLIGTFFDPGFLGAIFVLTLVLLTVKIWENEKWKMVWLVVYIALALTYSRASYLGFLAAMGIVSLLKKQPKFFAGILGLLLVTILLLPRPGGEGVRLERDSTIRLRIINWQHALDIIKDHPIFGVGFNAYRYAQEKYGYLGEYDGDISHAGAGVDSSILFVLATTGILGLLSYLWLWEKSFATQDLFILASGIGLITHSMFTNTLFYPWIMGWWWILLGLAKE